MYWIKEDQNQVIKMAMFKPGTGKSLHLSLDLEEDQSGPAVLGFYQTGFQN
jgi:hypothetical protein